MAKKNTGASNAQSTAPAEDADLDVDLEVSDEVRSAAEQVVAAREQLRAAEALLEQAREKAVDGLARMRDKNAGELIDATLDLVRKHPGLGVLTAASVGFLFARLFRR